MLAAQGAETLAILERGTYDAPSGRTIDLHAALAASVAATRDVRPEEAVPAPPKGRARTRIEVTDETTLAAVRRLAGRGIAPGVLNFASARNPGGGFLGGAQAQEESLARASGLYACLRGRPMYDHHREFRDPFYTDWAIASPGVPVFRDDSGALLEEAHLASFVTCAAVNAGVVLEREPGRRSRIAPTMRNRIARVLAIFAVLECESIVLGAWGCGVFRCDPSMIAEEFRHALDGAFQGVFDEAVFAIVDERVGSPIRKPFEAVFAGWGA